MFCRSKGFRRESRKSVAVAAHFDARSNRMSIQNVQPMKPIEGISKRKHVGVHTVATTLEQHCEHSKPNAMTSTFIRRSLTQRSPNPPRQN